MSKTADVTSLDRPGDPPQSSWKALGWKSWVAVCLIIVAGAAIWLSDSKEVDRAGVVLGAVVATLAALFAFLQLDAAKRQLRKAEEDAKTQSRRAEEQLRESRELVTQARNAVEASQRQHDLALKVAEAQALFSVDAALARYEDVRARLTPSGAPDPDVLQLRYYMAVFERLGVLLEKGTLSLQTVDRFYGSRFKALLEDGTAAKIVKGDREGWASFLSLWQSMQARRNLPDPDS